MEAVHKLVYALYTKEFSFPEFLYAHPHYKRGLVDILRGNLYEERMHEVFEPMAGVGPLPQEHVAWREWGRFGGSLSRNSRMGAGDIAGVESSSCISSLSWRAQEPPDSNE